jgi:DNA-binding NarL/FixJ family response regulator
VVVARLERLLASGQLAGEHPADATPELTMTDESTGAVYRLRAERAFGADGCARGIVHIEPAQSLDPATWARFGLSRRECEIAVGVVRGLTNAELASSLHMSAHTVQDNVGTVLDKVGARSRQELAFRLLGGP